MGNKGRTVPAVDEYTERSPGNTIALRGLAPRLRPRHDHHARDDGHAASAMLALRHGCTRARRRGRRLLQGQAGQPDRRLRHRRRLRRLCAADRAPYRQAHSRAIPTIVVQNMPGAGSLRGSQLTSTTPRPRTAPRSAPSRATCRCSACIKTNAERSVRPAQVHLARLLVELRQRRLSPVRAQGRHGEIDRGGAPRRRSADRPRQHRRRRDRATRSRSCCATCSGSTCKVDRRATPTAACCSWRSSAARSKAAPSGSRRCARPIPTGSRRTGWCRCWSRSAARRAIRISPTRRPRASSRKNDARPRADRARSKLPYRLSRPFAAPPGVPPDRAKALQDAFLATHKDPAYLAEAAEARAST